MRLSIPLSGHADASCSHGMPIGSMGPVMPDISHFFTGIFFIGSISIGFIAHSPPPQARLRFSEIRSILE
jgi:hypothetical protein